MGAIIAGWAQNKLPVRYDGTNFYIPRGEAASTHILKTSIDRLENTMVNEAFCMNLADRVGLNVPYARAINIGDDWSIGGTLRSATDSRWDDATASRGFLSGTWGGVLFQI
ncbi:MAG: HipA domain-containing protein [Desulfuromusa sp.]|nr:HipA domain-containing protein [Desulfuromusa sp.]